MDFHSLGIRVLLFYLCIARLYRAGTLYKLSYMYVEHLGEILIGTPIGGAKYMWDR